MTEKRIIAVLGATSLVGAGLLPLLTEKGWHVTAFSRDVSKTLDQNGVEWLTPGDDLHDKKIPYWICLAPISILPDYFEWMSRHGAKQVVALSSTSRFTKLESSDPSERALARKLADNEEKLVAWAAEQGVKWNIFRPTLIYGLGLDRNVSQIAKLIRRFGFFPLLGEGKGLRQPIHLEDLASVCVSALQLGTAANYAFNVSGSEILTYREMVSRIFEAIGKPARFVTIPLWLFRAVMSGMSILPAFRKWSPAMVERMNHNMIFDHSEATRKLGFTPRRFVLGPGDLQN